LVEVQETERSTIARELHDEASQALIGLVFALDILKRDANNPQAVAANVDELNRLVNGVLENLHRLAVDLRPATLDYLGLTAATRQYIAGVREKYGLAIQDEYMELPQRLPPDMETIIYRIIQEALANVVRHAKATQAEVRIEPDHDKIRVRISDNGSGFNLDEALAKKRLGLFGMRERAEMLGGSLKVESEPGCGTRISLEAPYIPEKPPGL
jgi:signal transduction histidine kinase